jgi:hypothetical protein
LNQEEEDTEEQGEEEVTVDETPLLNRSGVKIRSSGSSPVEGSADPLISRASSQYRDYYNGTIVDIFNNYNRSFDNVEEGAYIDDFKEGASLGVDNEPLLLPVTHQYSNYSSQDPFTGLDDGESSLDETPLVTNASGCGFFGDTTRRRRKNHLVDHGKKRGITLKSLSRNNYKNKNHVMRQQKRWQKGFREHKELQHQLLSSSMDSPAVAPSTASGSSPSVVGIPMDSSHFTAIGVKAMMEVCDGIGRSLADTYHHSTANHVHVFEAICVTVQYQMDNGAEIFAA